MKRHVLMISAMLLGGSAMAQNTPSQITELESRIEADSSDWKSMHQLARIYKEKSNTKSTLKYIEMALQVHESDTLKREQAQCYYSRGYYDKCTQICKQLVATDSLEQDLMLLTNSIRKTPYFDPSELLHYQKALYRRNPLNQSNTQLLVQLLLEINKAEAALEYINGYCDLDADNLVMNSLKAKALYLNDKLDESINEYKNLIEAGACSALNYYYMGSAYYKLKKYNEALEILTKANALSLESNPNIMLKLGLTQLKINGEGQNGVATLSSAMELMEPDPKMLFSIYYNIADFYDNTNTQKALEFYKKASAYTSHNPGLTYRIANCYRKLQNLKKEADYLAQFLKVSEDSVLNASVRQRLNSIKEERFMNGQSMK